LRRLDIEIVKRHLARSRGEAKDLIESGLVEVNGFTVQKTATLVSPDAAIKILEARNGYVSRGANKLLSILPMVQIDFTNKVVVDAGASTGGFVQVALELGAKKVYAVDVGYGQLAWSIQTNPKVVVMDRTNVKNLVKANFAEEINIVMADLSFISLKSVMPVICELVESSGDLLLMVKPQFEVGKDKVGRGVVTDPDLRTAAVNGVIAVANQFGWFCVGAAESLIHGPSGNREFFIHLRKNGAELSPAQIAQLISREE
jgi:23S rRNA (cytidine1920-2'-O)/16S rRNA (cytidine1409-2'-O)-methyltransferase